MPLCIICKKPEATVKVTSKGILSLLTVSEQRKDSLHESLSLTDDPHLHEHCRKSYTARKNIKTAQSTTPTRSLRNADDNFDYCTCCLICGQKIDTTDIQKHPDRHDISQVEIINNDKKSVLQETLLDVCDQRQDDNASTVKARILYAGDIRAVEARYHRRCHQRFTSPKNIKHSHSTDNPRNSDQENNTAFIKLCRWLEEKNINHVQFTLQDVHKELSSYLPRDTEPYSIKHLKRRLIDTFGSKMTFSEIDGKPNVITFNCAASSILHGSYNQTDILKESEDTKTIRQAGSILKDEIRKWSQVQDESPDYPSPNDINLDELEGQVPPLLLNLIDNILPKSRSLSSIAKRRILILSLCHVMIQAASGQSYISSLMLCVGLFIHQLTRSRVLLNVLSSLGLGLGQVSGFCQWIADNFDHNEDTVNGQDTTHVMGIITCQTPKASKTISIPKQKVTSAEIVKAGTFGNLLKPYHHPVRSQVSNVVFEELQPINLPMTNFQSMDMLWIVSQLLSNSSPSWQGFMSQVTGGTIICSSVMYNPIIPLNPQTMEAVYSTMSFVDLQRKKSGQCCGQITFDQALYAKAYKVKVDNPKEFRHLSLRLGGFHQLMSFLGAGCKCMQDCGLEDVWATVYANKTIPKMMEGKAYTKTLRACLLTDAALQMIIFSPEESSCNIDFSQGRSKVTWSEFLDNINFPEIQNLKVSVLENQKSYEDVQNDPNIQHCIKYIDQEKSKLQVSRTGKLWIQFMEFVTVVRNFIRAERTGNWKLHLKTSSQMLPFFAAAGHNNYTKYCRLYLQDCQNLCPCLQVQMEKGNFTIRRNEKLFWTGTWSDMVIEQCLMRAGKTQGALINVTHRESARTKWLLSAHIVTQYTDALRILTNTQSGSWSEQHKEVNIGRIKQDLQDMHTFEDYLRSHNPFVTKDSLQLRNIATGMIADKSVNVDTAQEIGAKQLEKMTNQKFGDVVLKKSDQAVTFAVMRKALKIGNEDIHISSSEVYQRLLSLACLTGPPKPSVFSYELAAVCPALFHDDGSMRKCQKSQLARHIAKLHPNIISSDPDKDTVLVIDGCALLQQMQWPKMGLLRDVCSSFCKTVTVKAKNCLFLHVVFDSYEVQTTKEPEQKRRRLQKSSVADVEVEDTTPVPSDKSGFLSNKFNKQALIYLIAEHLKSSNISVEHAGEEGDADVVIVKEALSRALEQPVCVCSDDTDVLVLLLHHCSDRHHNVFMKTKTMTYSITRGRLLLGPKMCQCLPFIHAVSGCDTTSALFGMGKVKHFKLIQQSEHLQEEVEVFGNISTEKKNIAATGENYVSSLYQGENRSLDEVRYLNIISSKYVPLGKMPPTSRACYFHSLRVHHQVATWKHLRTVLDRNEFGFKTIDNVVVPTITDKQAAPDNLLREVRCSCSKQEESCSTCSCVKRRMMCSIHCRCSGNCLNPPPTLCLDSEDEE